MSELTEMNEILSATGLKTYAIVLTLAGFKATEHEDTKLVTDYGMDNEKDYGKVLFFNSDCYIQYYKDRLPMKPWQVMLGRDEFGFGTKNDAIRHLYHEHYLVECTDLF